MDVFERMLEAQNERDREANKFQQNLGVNSALALGRIKALGD
jgi:hypothetical protein